MDYNRCYLGDNVYVDIENGMIKLCTNNGYEDENVIYLDSNVTEELLCYIERMAKEIT